MPEANHYDLIIVGGGILGSATFYEFVNKYPDQRVLLLEKESKLAAHQTGRNSGVIHSGIYYTPGSLKAKNCREGLKLLYEFCEKHKVPYDNCGKLIVATKPEEVTRLEKLKERGIQNGLKGLQLLNATEAKEYEPFVECIKALYVPDTGIVDYAMVTQKLVELGTEINRSSTIKYNQEVISFVKEAEVTVIKTKKDSFRAEKVIFCTGLQSDRFAKKDGINIDVRVVPFRGDYFVLNPEANHKVKNLIYPVADPDLPFLGVHLTRMMNGTIECGPNAVFSFDREGYRKTAFDLQDTKDALNFSGTWKLFSKFWKTGVNEYLRSFLKKRFLESLQQMIPSLEMKDLGNHRAGVRAQVVDKSGNLVDDFLIERGNCGVHVINAPSPAATASLSIAKQIVKTV
jgi:L-2-hydroxyglutarate oxidase